MKRNIMLVMALACVGVLAFSEWLEARTKLTTLPRRERVEVQLENPQYTLLEEERIVTLLKGTNLIDFSWANSQIDKKSIQFRPITMLDKVRVINVSYPPNENALVWEVYADKAGPCKVRISYLISNLSRKFSYRAVAAHNEKHMLLRKYIRLDNFCGEEYAGAGIWAGFGKYFRKMLGLNESKQMLMHKFMQVPIKKTFTFDWYSCPPVPDEPESKYVRLHYVLKNDKANNMGLFPLQFGKVRIFQEDGHGSVAFLGEDWGQFTPIDDEMSLYLGLARDVSVKRKVTTNNRRRINGDLHDNEVVIEYEIENFKKEDVVLYVEEDLNLVRNQLWGQRGMDAEWEMGEQTTFKTGFDSLNVTKVRFSIPCPKEGKNVLHKFHFILRNVW